MLVVACLAFSAIVGFADSSFAAHLVAYWKLDEAGSQFYADSSWNGIALTQDSDTTVARVAHGINGTAAQLNWQEVPGVSTRLFAQHAALQTDSFGFSLWINPVNLSPNDNLIAKEMPFDNSVPGYSRLAWQVHLGGDNGSGLASLEFIVRGNNRTQGNFFGNVSSAANIPLYADSNDWIHVAGGYDATTGALALFVNGVKYDSNNSSPGAHSSDGSPITIGSVRNGADFVAYAAGADIDDVQLYNGPVSASEVAALIANPGGVNSNSVTASFPATLLAHWKLNELSPPYADSGWNGISLNQDAATTLALTGAGLEGLAAQLNWQSTPGVSTRLFASNAVLQTDSFGFSFWFSPVYLAPFDNFIAKEMPYDNTVPGYSRLAWQVHLGDDNGSGAAPLEFVVRGNDRSQGDFFGNVFSAGNIPLYSESSEWIHVAGGYNATSGALSLFVNGVEADSANSIPGAHSSDGSPFAIGTARNGADFVAFAAGAFIDDVQLYNGPVSADKVVTLMGNPGWAITDADGDGIPDGWELQHGLNPQVNDAAGDADGDGISNLDEYRMGTDPQVPNTSSDAVVLTGSQATTNRLGQWTVDGTDIYAVDRRGYVEYALNVTTADIYRLEVEAAENGFIQDTNTFDLALSVDGENLGRCTLTALSTGTGKVDVLTPWLPTGTHIARVFWDNPANAKSLRIKFVRLQTLAGADTNGDGRKDWVESVLASDNGITTAGSPITSYVSPACIEGRVLFLSIMTVIALAPGGTTTNVAVHHAPDDAWYANVPLTSNTNTALTVSYENGGLVETKNIQWVAKNLLDGGNLTIRKGDSVLFIAAPSGAANGAVTITMGATQYSTTPNAPVAQLFSAAGTFTVSGSFNDGNQNLSGSINVTVLEHNFATNPDCWVGKPRIWDVPNVPPGVVIQSDSRLQMTQLASLANNDRLMQLQIDQNEPRYIVSRISTNGPILATTLADGFRVFAGPDT
jgi:hypothetical protein